MASVTVQILGDSSSVERAFARSAKSAKTFNRQMTGQLRITQSALGGLGGAVSALGLTFGAAGFVAGIKNAIGQASSLQEEMSKSKVVFDDSADAIAAWSTTTSKAFSISQQDALAAASNFGLLFETIGKGDKVTAAMSRDFVELAGDLASFFNVTTDTALEKLRAGLAGEAEPLRQFGVFITEAKVQAEAYGTGIAKAGRKLTEAQKIQARYNLIMRETGPAHGDAARTANTWANVSRRIGAQIEEVGAKIGTVLLPKLTELGTKFSDWLSDTRNQERLASALSNAIGRVAGAIATVGTVLSTVRDAFGGWQATFTVLAGAWLGFKLAGIGAAFAVSAANVVAAGVTARAWQAALISTGWGALAVAAGIAAAYVVTHWEKVKVWFREFYAWLQVTGLRAFRQVIEPLSKIPDWLPGLGRVGQWARGMENQLNAAIGEIEAAAGRLGEAGGTKAGTSFADQFNAELRKALAELPKIKVPKAPPPLAGGGAGGGGGLTANERAGRRNQWFDARIGRQLDRLQDLGLRKQLERLKQIAAEVRVRIAVTKDVTRRLNLEDQLLGIMRRQKQVQEDITGQIKAANQALKERADAIKQAVLDRLQRRQTDVLNKRALADAKEQLRIAREIGGPKGIEKARRALEDVRFDILRARIENAPATLAPGGRFQLGGVITINIHGVTDPEAVARKVAAVLQKRGKHTTTQQRGAAPATA